MTTRPTALRRRVLRAAAVRLAQRGSAARGLIVVAALVAAVALQLASPRLQCRLADLVGVPSVTPTPAPAPAPASMPSCGTPAADNSMRPCKVATMAAADTGHAPTTF